MKHELPICAKLARRHVCRSRHETTTHGIINPDGPEAAAVIGELVEALEKIAATASVSVSTDKAMYRGWRKVAVERIDIARAALAHAREGAK